MDLVKFPQLLRDQPYIASIFFSFKKRKKDAQENKKKKKKKTKRKTASYHYSI